MEIFSSALLFFHFQKSLVMPKRSRKTGNPKVHAELQGFTISINQFGQIVSTTEIDNLNTFLNRNVEDKKLKEMELVTVE